MSFVNSGQNVRILMIAPQPFFQPRGTPFSVLYRIKALTTLGYHVDLVTYFLGQNIDMDNLTIYRAAKIPFIKQIKVGPSIAKIFLDFALILKTKSLLKSNDYDYIHTHEEASFFGSIFAKRKKIPHLYDMHSCLPQQLLNFKFTKSKIILGIFENLERHTILNSNAVITICPELQKYVNSQFPNTTSMLIENVTDNSIVFPVTVDNQENLIKKYSLEGKRIILYYGTFEPYQGINLLIESAKFVLSQADCEPHFILVGGNDKQIHEYKERAQQHGVAAHFTFTGFVPPELIPSFISIADVLVSPRLEGNNSPLKIYSYLRSGKPIIATRHITHTQVLDDRVAVLVEATPQTFADGILSVLKKSQKTLTMVKAAQELAEKKYNYENYLQKTKWIVDQVMKEN